MLKIGDKIKITKVLNNAIYWAGKGVVRDRIYTVNLVGKRMFKFGKRNTLCYIENDVDFEYEIVKENDNMKKLTFKQVIKNIKDGETWENENLEITYDVECAEIIFRFKNGISIDNQAAIYKFEVFTLRREPVSFTKAFEAYEKGSEVESCVSGCKYKKEGDKAYYKEPHDEIFEAFTECAFFEEPEIRGKWYINE